MQATSYGDGYLTECSIFTLHPSLLSMLTCLHPGGSTDRRRKHIETAGSGYSSKSKRPKWEGKLRKGAQECGTILRTPWCDPRPRPGLAYRRACRREPEHSSLKRETRLRQQPASSLFGQRRTTCRIPRPVVALLCFLNLSGFRLGYLGHFPPTAASFALIVRFDAEVLRLTTYSTAFLRKATFGRNCCYAPSGPLRTDTQFLAHIFAWTSNVGLYAWLMSVISRNPPPPPRRAATTTVNCEMESV